MSGRATRGNPSSLVTLLIHHGVHDAWKRGLNCTKIRQVFVQMGISDITIPTKKHPYIGSPCLPIGLKVTDARDVLRFDRAIPFPGGDCRAILNPLLEALYLQIRVSNSQFHLSFFDADSLLDLLPHSSGAVAARQPEPHLFNVYFARAEDLFRFYESPPPFLADFRFVHVKVKHDLSIFLRSEMKAAWDMTVFPVVYQYQSTTEKPWVNKGQLKALVQEELGARVLHHVHPYPAQFPQQKRGILFFRAASEALEFWRDGLQTEGVRLFRPDCNFNDRYRFFSGH